MNAPQPRPQPTTRHDEDFEFDLTPDGGVHLNFGATRIALSIDASYELQQRLAEFLAELEMADYPAETRLEAIDCFESRATWESLLPQSARSGKLDS